MIFLRVCRTNSPVKHAVPCIKLTAWPVSTLSHQWPPPCTSNRTITRATKTTNSIIQIVAAIVLHQWFIPGIGRRINIARHQQTRMRSSTLNWSTVVYYKFGNLTNVHQKDNFFSFIERHTKLKYFCSWSDIPQLGFFSSTIVLNSLAMSPWVHEQQEGALVRYSQIPAVIFSVNSNDGSMSVNQYLILLRADRDEEEGC